MARKPSNEDSDDESVVLLETIPVPNFRQQTLTQMRFYPPMLDLPSADEEEEMFATQSFRI